MHYFPSSQIANLANSQKMQQLPFEGPQQILIPLTNSDNVKILHFEMPIPIPTATMLDNGLLEELLKDKERKLGNDLFAEFIAHIISSTQSHQSNLQQQNSMNSSNFVANFSGFLPPISITKSPTTSIGNQFKMNSSKTQNEGKNAEKLEANLNELNAPAAAAGHHQRPHRCDQCQKSFRFKSNLFEHKSLHLATSNRNPFVCPFCAKTCRLKGNLKKHLQVHVTSVDDLERLWKRSFSRQSGRPRKNAPPAPLPKPGDDLGLVPVLPSTGEKRPNSSSSSNSSSSTWRYSPISHQQTIQWTFADQFQRNENKLANLTKIGEENCNQTSMQIFSMENRIKENFQKLIL